MDGSVEMKRKLEMLGDMPAVDMTIAEGEASVGDRKSMMMMMTRRRTG
jgi:hypothetical protein